MDVTPFLELKPAPYAVFDHLDERRGDVRFYVRGADGDDWRPVTWDDFAARIRHAALWLSEIGLAPGDRAAVFALNSVDWAAAALAIQSAGGVMVPIYPSSTADQASYILQHSDARVLFVDDRKRAPSDCGVVEHVVSFGDHSWPRALELGGARDALEPGAFDALLGAVDLDQPGVMLYTSGTTGNPKGVPLTHRNTAVNGRDWLENNASLLSERAVDLLWLPLSHIFGFGEMCLGNALGFTSYMSDPYKVLGELPAVAPTVFMSVPAYWEKLAIAAQQSSFAAVTGGKLQFCLSGGAGLKREIKEYFHAQGVLIIEGYGLTECSPTLTLNRPDAFRFDTVGLPLPSVELRLADDGEILARGPNIFGGYHKDPEATKAAFTDDGWFKTGDVGRFTDDGFLQIVDRKKDILVTAGGKNIPPANIELRFCDDPLIQHLVVYGDGKRYLVAGVWLDHATVGDLLGPSPSQDSVRGLVQAHIDEVNGSLPRHETIKQFVTIDTPLTVDNGLLTASLKIRRKKIYDAFRGQFEALYGEPA